MTAFTMWANILNIEPTGFGFFGLAVVILFLMLVCVVVPGVATLGFFDRKLSADFQARVGPNRCGPAGVFQGFSDYLKLLQKQGLPSTGKGERSWIFIQSFFLFTTLAVLPLGQGWLLLDSGVSVAIPFLAILLLSLGRVFFGLRDQEDLERWVGSLRQSGQTLSAALPGFLSIVAVGAKTGDYHWSKIIEAQGFGVLGWNITADPFLFLSFFVFVLSGLILLGIPPFDSSGGAQDIRGALQGEHWGWRQAQHRFFQLYGLFLWTVLAAGLFLGGSNLPAGLDLTKPVQIVLEPFLVLLKATGITVMIVWVARVSPRGRVDQITDFSWRVLAPLSLFCFLGTAWFSFFGRAAQQ